MIKYELFLPLKYNDGKEIEIEKHKRTREDLIALFGAVTVSPINAHYQGTWKYGGVEFVDDIIKLEVITESDEKTERFFKDYKEHLKELLEQIDILITAQEIRRI